MAKDELNSIQTGFNAGPHPGPQSELGDGVTSGAASTNAPLVFGTGDDSSDDSTPLVDLNVLYTLIDELGSGGMGSVRLAMDKNLKRKVAIKRIRSDLATNRSVVKRFLSEGRAVAQLNHPNIVQVYSSGRDQDGPFLILEYVDGQSLLERCRSGIVPLEEAVDLTCQLCDALSVTHDAHIFHRDIKPANVLLTKNGIPKLTDFGLAKDATVDGSLSVAGVVMGTLDYMPPEQRKDSALVDARSDLWSLAATLYQMVTGKTPRVIKLNDVPAQLHDVLAKALEDAKAARFQSAREFRDALRSCLRPNTPATAITVELGEGICPTCGTQNDLVRKFCRKCATALRMSCLSCHVDLPVWDNICGECGENQERLRATKTQELESQRNTAEAFRATYNFSEALQIARELAGLTDVRFADQKHWADNFLTTVREENSRQLAKAASCLESAQKLREEFDYASAIYLLESVPEPMRSPEMMSYLQQLHSDQREVDQLIPVIADRVQRRDLVGLLTQVDRAVELQGDRADLRTLQRQLRERHEKQIRHRDEAYENAASTLNRGQAKEALALVESVKTHDLRSSDLELKTRLEKIVAAEDDLMNLVRICKADGVLEPDEVISLLVNSEKYLQMNPGHEKIIAMRDQLIGKIQKDPDRFTCRQKFGEIAASLWGALGLGVTKNSLGMQVKLIPAGEFMMGGITKHRVHLSRPFFVGVHQVTQGQFQQVMGKNPSRFKGTRHPVEQVSWGEAVEFCKKLSALTLEKKAGRVYRLPTEGEWEYACRAGAMTAYSFGDDTSDLDTHAWYCGNSGDTTHPVGQKLPNAWGLYDMHGNVWEWCSDWCDSYPTKEVTDPAGPPSGVSNILRGGSWRNGAMSMLCSYRLNLGSMHRHDTFGFRVIMEE